MWHRALRLSALAFLITCSAASVGCGTPDGGDQNDDNDNDDEDDDDVVVPTPTGVLRTIAAGEHHSCALDAIGGAWCWGLGEQGQLGHGAFVGLSAEPQQVRRVANAVDLAAGLDHTCALDDAGAVLCWGEGSSGRLGVGFDDVNLPVTVEVPTEGIVVGIAAGGGTTCAFDDAGLVWCWGINNDGQLGDGTTTSRATPAPVAGLDDVIQLAVGDFHVCALRLDGGVACWGFGANGQLGAGDFENRTGPTEVLDIEGALRIAAGSRHSCALVASGEVRCWGANGSRQLGNDSTEASPTPVTVAGLAPAVDVSLGRDYSCAVTADGGLSCWGLNYVAVIGAGDLIEATPLAVADLAGVVDLATGVEHACARDGAGLACWGRATSGALGNGDDLQLDEAVTVANLADVSGIALGGAHSCAVTALPGGAVRCWGANSVGQAGQVFIQDVYGGGFAVAGITSPAVSVAAGLLYGCAALVDGTVSCWGNNTTGQVAPGGPEALIIPAEPVAGVVDAVFVAGGTFHACSLNTLGGVQCWGRDGEGQLGDGPGGGEGVVDVIGLNGPASMLAVGAGSNCVVLEDGAVACWGFGRDGQLGNDGTANADAPVLVPGIADATAVAVGDFHACAIVDSGTLACWGDNFFGQLGAPLEVELSLTPRTVEGIDDVVAIAAGRATTCAVVQNGDVSCWGDGLFGQRVPGESANDAVPKVVPLPTGAVSIAVGSVHSCAGLDDSTAACWGNNALWALGGGLVGSLPVNVAAFE
jgi:alpha-tubulin suppressor-like RCC1 family protein